MLVARTEVPAAVEIGTYCKRLTYDTVSSSTWLPPFQRQILPPFQLKMRKVKVNFSLCLTKYSITKAWGVTVRLHVFLNPHTRWKWVCSFTLRHLYSKMNPLRCTLNRRPGGLHCLFRSFREEKEIWCFGRNQIAVSRSYSSWSTYNTEWEIEAIKGQKSEQKKQTKKLAATEPLVIIHRNK